MATDIFHWGASVADSIIASLTIAPGTFQVGDLKSLDNVYSEECHVSVTPSVPGATASQILFAPLGDIDGTNTINPTTIPSSGSPGARQPIAIPVGQPLASGVTYRNFYVVKGKDFSGFRPCIFNNSNVPVTVTYKTSATNTA